MTIQESKDAAEFRVATFNVNGQISWYPHEPHKQWKNRAPLVVKVLKNAHPHIICFQEAGETIREDVLDKLPYLDYYLGEKAGDIFINTIAWDRQRYACKTQKTLWLSDDGTYKKGWDGAERGCSKILLEDEFTGQDLWVYNVHLDNKGIIARREGVREILADIAQFVGHVPVIVGGDFNLGTVPIPGREEYHFIEPHELLLHAGLKDAWYEWSPMPPRPTFHMFTGMRAYHEPDPFVWNPDWVFLLGDMQVTDLEIIQDHEGMVYPSDHYPVLVSLRYGAA